MNPLLVMALRTFHEKATKFVEETDPVEMKQIVVKWVAGLSAQSIHEKATSLLRFVGTLIKGKS